MKERRKKENRGSAACEAFATVGVADDVSYKEPSAGLIPAGFRKIDYSTVMMCDMTIAQ